MKFIVILIMKFFSGKASAVQLQYVIWGILFLVILFSMLPMNGPKQSVIYATLIIIIYAIIVYGNLNFLMPFFYEKGRIVQYVTASILFLVLTGIARAGLLLFIYNRFFAEKPVPLDIKAMA